MSRTFVISGISYLGKSVVRWSREDFQSGVRSWISWSQLLNHFWTKCSTPMLSIHHRNNEFPVLGWRTCFTRNLMKNKQFHHQWFQTRAHHQQESAFKAKTYFSVWFSKRRLENMILSERPKVESEILWLCDSKERRRFTSYIHGCIGHFTKLTTTFIHFKKADQGVKNSWRVNRAVKVVHGNVPLRVHWTWIAAYSVVAHTP